MPTSTRLGRADLPDLMTLMTGDEKHGPSATSTLDVLWVLYDRVLRVDPRVPDDPERDRFLLSKGHGPAAYCLTVAVVDNHSSTYHWPGGLAARFELEGWSSARVDGRDHDALKR